MAHQTQQTLGIIGGMSWESTESYYRLINEGIKHQLGGLHSDPCRQIRTHKLGRF